MPRSRIRTASRPRSADYDLHLLGEGTHYRLYEQLGAHPARLDGVDGVRFAVWAPNARRVSVVGDFNGWDGRRHPMRLHPGNGIWEIFVPGVGRGARYKFEIIGRVGRAPRAQGRPVRLRLRARRRRAPPPSVCRLDALRLGRRGAGWPSARRRHALRRPMSIYEVHLGSWRRVPEEGDRFLELPRARPSSSPTT